VANLLRVEGVDRRRRGKDRRAREESGELAQLFCGVAKPSSGLEPETPSFRQESV
jgi:hypothetical protein